MTRDVLSVSDKPNRIPSLRTALVSRKLYAVHECRLQDLPSTGRPTSNETGKEGPSLPQVGPGLISARVASDFGPRCSRRRELRECSTARMAFPGCHTASDAQDRMCVCVCGRAGGRAGSAP